MEDTLGAKKRTTFLSNTNRVLILVLMEDTLGVYENPFKDNSMRVLILVLMEDTLGDMNTSLDTEMYFQS